MQMNIERVFISYSTKDSDTAKSVCSHLESNNINCWMAPRDISPGSSYPSQIVHAIRDCKVFVLILSSNSNVSKHVSNEVANAFDNEKTIIPFVIDDTELSDDLVYFLKRKQNIDGMSDFSVGLNNLLRTISDELSIKIDQSISVKKEEVFSRNNEEKNKLVNKKSDKKTISFATYEELIDLGWDNIGIAKRLVENDYALYPDTTAENEGTPEQWAEFLSSYPETFGFLIDENIEIIGNWSFMAVSEDLHVKQIISGELVEETLKVNEAEFLLFPGEYVGYLLNMSLNIGYNNAINTKLLISSFIERLKSLADNGIFFKEWYVNVFRKDHEAMFRGMGFSYLVDNHAYGKIYHMPCNPFPHNSLFEKNKELKEIYDDKFK